MKLIGIDFFLYWIILLLLKISIENKRNIKFLCCFDFTVLFFLIDLIKVLFILIVLFSDNFITLWIFKILNDLYNHDFILSMSNYLSFDYEMIIWMSCIRNQLPFLKLLCNRFSLNVNNLWIFNTSVRNNKIFHLRN